MENLTPDLILTPLQQARDIKLPRQREKFTLVHNTHNLNQERIKLRLVVAPIGRY